MGNYRITIEGIGAHHGFDAGCAEIKARRLIGDLVGAGHNDVSGKLEALIGDGTTWTPNPDMPSVELAGAADETAAITRVFDDSGDHVAQFFAYAHLPPHLRSVSRMFALLAVDIIQSCPRNPERTVALRKLLEAKDAAVRAALAKPC
jgi:hypothetical protein